MSKRIASLAQPHFPKKRKMTVSESLDAGCKTAQKEEDEEENQPQTYLDNLNDDCLIAIFELLDEDDWIELCKYNDRFRLLVVNHVVPRKLFDFGKISYKIGIENVFKLFGKSLRKIKIEKDYILCTTSQYTKLDEFLRLIQTHCAEGKIIDLDITFCIRFSQHTERLLVQVIPFIRNVVNLRVNVSGGYRSHATQFLKTLPLGNVQSFELNGPLSTDFNWFRAVPFGNLHHFRIGCSTNLASSEEFFESQPNLKTFVCDDQITTCLESIAKHSSNIEKISPIQTKWYDDTTGAVVDSTRVVKTWLHRLDKLKSMELVATSKNGSDLFEILNCVSKNNVLSSLVVRFDPNYFISGRSVELKNVNFSNLTHLHFIVESNPIVNQHFFDDFVSVALAHMKNVKKFIVNSKQSENLDQGFVLQIVKILEQLCVLVIDVRVDFTKKFYLELIEARKIIQKNQNRLQHKPITIRFFRFYGDLYRTQLGDVYNENVVKITNNF